MTKAPAKPLDPVDEWSTAAAVKCNDKRIIGALRRSVQALMVWQAAYAPTAEREIAETYEPLIKRARGRNREMLEENYALDMEQPGVVAAVSVVAELFSPSRGEGESLEGIAESLHGSGDAEVLVDQVPPKDEGERDEGQGQDNPKDEGFKEGPEPGHRVLRRRKGPVKRVEVPTREGVE